eukprot:gb/GECH01008021.1/.p1 GENE.gb/GECH01008021.1/~~gb/GECH01008021.1/.p1  ORF type:complete len:374 (+),score=66.33 gb/GECH01008021.1/:1-1122(+)
MKKTEHIHIAPGPTQPHPEVLKAHGKYYGSADIESEFLSLYQRVCRKLRQLVNVNQDDESVTPVVMSGEAMVCLWGAIKSVLHPGDKVIAVGNGIYSYGIADMARTVGADVWEVRVPPNTVIGVGELEKVRRKAEEWSPKLITACHCETPSGTINSNSTMKTLGQISSDNDALFYVDMVSSTGGVPIDIKDWKVDLGIIGSQKALSCPPNFGIVCVSNRTWPVIQDVEYAGYDALLPWKDVLVSGEFPYTHNWNAIAALNASLSKMFEEGLDNVYHRHSQAAQMVRHRAHELGLELWPEDESYSSPTVTAIKLPRGSNFTTLDKSLRVRGVHVAPSFGEMSGKVFRIGHMGTQANIELLERVMDILKTVIKEM